MAYGCAFFYKFYYFFKIAGSKKYLAYTIKMIISRGGVAMQILNNSIFIIDYEGSRIINRETPETFNEYVNELINHINSNTSVREYKTRSNQNEIISSIRNICQNNTDEEAVSSLTSIIANRLLLKEIEAQQGISHLDTNVQKGSLIQALLCNEDAQTYRYLLAKVEHSDFVDDADFSFKTGFSKNKKTIWKSCLFDIIDINAQQFYAKIYSNTVAKYWSDNFLELDEIINDELNTLTAFRAVDATLNQNLKGIITPDHTIIRNAIISYFKCNEHIDFPIMIESILGSYVPVNLEAEKIHSLKEKMLQLPEKKKFDSQFESVPNIINARIKKVYSVNEGIQLKITDAVIDISNTITAYRDADGTRYIKIKTNNDNTFRSFNNQQ